MDDSNSAAYGSGYPAALHDPYRYSVSNAGSALPSGLPMTAPPAAAAIVAAPPPYGLPPSAPPPVSLNNDFGTLSSVNIDGSGNRLIPQYSTAPLGTAPVGGGPIGAIGIVPSYSTASSIGGQGAAQPRFAPRIIQPGN
jgi:hypothetical protein